MVFAKSEVNIIVAKAAKTSYCHQCDLAKTLSSEVNVIIEKQPKRDIFCFFQLI